MHRSSLEVDTESILSSMPPWVNGKQRGRQANPNRWQVKPFGREHLLPGVGIPTHSGLRYAPDFLVCGWSGRYRDGSPKPPQWSVFLECKASRHDHLAIDAKALRGYEKWQAMSGLPVFILTRIVTAGQEKALPDFRVMSVRQILKAGYQRKHLPIPDHENGGHVQGVVSNACVMVPKADFIWPLADLMEQLVEGRKRLAPKEAGQCS